MLAASGEFHFVQQPPNQRLATAAGFLKQSRQPGRAAVNMVLDDRAVGEELVLAEVALAVGLCDQGTQKYLVLADEGRPLHLAAAETRTGCNACAVLDQRKCEGDPRQRRFLQLRFKTQRTQDLIGLA